MFNSTQESLVGLQYGPHKADVNSQLIDQMNEWVNQ